MPHIMPMGLLYVLTTLSTIMRGQNLVKETFKELKMIFMIFLKMKILFILGLETVNTVALLLKILQIN